MAFVSFAAMATVLASPAVAEEAAPDAAADAYGAESIVVTGRATTYNNSEVSAPMLMQQAPLTSALATIDNLPGVSVQEGDTFGFDDWSTTISIRGFQTNLDEQQIGITIDGLPNGNSGYGGGAKANRYIDSANIGTVSVSQGTSDIASLSNEALGGTIDFATASPEDDRRIRFSASIGEFDAMRYYARYDTGRILGDTTKAWISISHQEASDWINGSAENERDHIAAKFESDLSGLRLTGYMSYDDTHEDNYQRVFSAADFILYPEWDQLTAEWTGIPYIDQSYRKGWSTLRENFFTYLKADGEVTEGLTLNGAVYYHKNTGRGDWVPPYLVDVTDDGAGNPESELGNNTVSGGAPLGRIYFVDANGLALAPTAGCISSLTFPYGGGGAEYDPACYPAGAVGVQSYRHTHYEKDRLGFAANFNWEKDFGSVSNVLRGGVWYEDTTRYEHRDWHKIVDTRVGFEFNEAVPYWTQYDRKYPQTTFKWYVEDQLSFAGFTATFGVKQFLNDVERVDLFGETSDVKVDSDSDVLLSGGLQYEPVSGLELFAGYAENFKSITDDILERPDSDLNIEPETARNIDVGVRYNRGPFSASATYFNIEFDNHIIFLSNNTTAGPDYLIGTNGSYFNAGGIESEGIELVANVDITEQLNAYMSYTYTDAKYIGSGDPLVDAAVGIIPGNRVTGIPENMAVLSLNWADGPFRFGISGKYTDDRYVDVANSFVAESYFLTDLYVGVKGEAISEAFKALDLSLTVNNMFDEDYLGGISGGGAWIGAPRTVVFTLTADF
ncbi:MAG: TonB-dependent receptor [Sphingobium sp.]|nr:TonB-dependent receptor [Sphingobium sp.]MCP5400087.1 TonB-dependent receptor [Sphingomonas sp.]